jgi:acyl carrier protein
MADTESSGGGRPADSIAERVRAIVARTARRRAVVDELHLARDLQLDDAGRIELLMVIELAFRFDFTRAEAEAIATVGDLVETVGRKVRLAEPATGGGEALREAIEDLAAGAASAGEAIDVAAASLSLAGDHPRSGLTLDEISDAIERAAAAAGAAIVPGSSRRSA